MCWNRTQSFPPERNHSATFLVQRWKRFDCFAKCCIPFLIPFLDHFFVLSGFSNLPCLATTITRFFCNAPPTNRSQFLYEHLSIVLAHAFLIFCLHSGGITFYTQFTGALDCHLHVRMFQPGHFAPTQTTGVSTNWTNVTTSILIRNVARAHLYESVTSIASGQRVFKIFTPFSLIPTFDFM